MDVEALTSLVYARPAIWNATDKKHADRDFVSDLWSEIAKELGCEGKLTVFHSVNYTHLFCNYTKII